MVTMKTEPPQATLSAPANPLAIVPEPTTEELLREQLANTEKERDDLTHSLSKTTAENADLKESLATYEEQLAGYEKNPFSYALTNLDAGSVVGELGDKLTALIALIHRRQDKGALTVKLKIKPLKGDSLVFAADVSVTEPKPEVAQSVFFADEGGAISRHDPRQKEFRFTRPQRLADDDDDAPQQRRR